LAFMTTARRPVAAAHGKGGIIEGLAFAARTEPFRALLLLERFTY